MTVVHGGCEAQVFSDLGWVGGLGFIPLRSITSWWFQDSSHGVFSSGIMSLDLLDWERLGRGEALVGDNDPCVGFESSCKQGCSEASPILGSSHCLWWWTAKKGPLVFSEGKEVGFWFLVIWRLPVENFSLVVRGGSRLLDMFHFSDLCLYSVFVRSLVGGVFDVLMLACSRSALSYLLCRHGIQLAWVAWQGGESPLSGRGRSDLLRSRPELDCGFASRNHHGVGGCGCGGSCPWGVFVVGRFQEHTTTMGDWEGDDFLWAGGQSGVVVGGWCLAVAIIGFVGR